MISALAWRNIWRNPTRSLVVIVAVMLGIWAAMFMSGFAIGMSRSYINNAIQNLYAHIQIHDGDFLKDKSVKYMIPDYPGLENSLAKNEHIEAFSSRSLVNGMIASGKSSRGLTIRGIDPAEEDSLNQLSSKLLEGTYFKEKRKNQILISKKLAEKLRVKLRSKLVLTFQDLNGTITAGAFRVAGIFQSGNAQFDEGNAFVRKEELNGLLLPVGDSLLSHLDPQDIVHEVAIMMKDPDLIDQEQALMNGFSDQLSVQNYREIAPDLQLYESQIKSVSLIYLTIIMLALIFGIINTMLMAVLERIKELGMLMAIGMNKLKVFLMIVFETLMLSLIGAPMGLLLGVLTTLYLSKKGINLSAFSDSMQMYGISEIVYFEQDPSVYVQIPVVVIITALLASIYPALKAIRLKPVEAIRKI